MMTPQASKSKKNIQKYMSDSTIIPEGVGSLHNNFALQFTLQGFDLAAITIML